MGESLKIQLLWLFMALYLLHARTLFVFG